MFAELSKLKNSSFSLEEQYKINKVLILCFLGSIFGHHTLNEIISTYNGKKSKLYSIYNRLSYKDLSQISLHLFKYYLTERLQELGNQSESSWSRACPTYIIDASVYKQWLSDHNFDCELFGKYFSGQTGKSEYGFRLTLGGIAIDDTFYPLLFTILPKHISDGEIASTMLLQMQTIVKQIATEKQLTFGKWYLSVDSGYSANALLDTCSQNEIIPICVPTKSHIFIINGKEIKLKEFIDNEFIVKEALYNTCHDPQTDEPFTMRKHVKYRTLDKEIILFFFRYKDSKKVSVIYSTDIEIKGKTLRHHWFQRTYIEQFFRFSKHTLKAAQSTADNVIDFVRKICLNFMKTIFCLTIRNQCRKNYRYFKNWTFGEISRFIIDKQICKKSLMKLVNLQNGF